MEFKRRILTQEDNERCEVQKPQIKNDENKKQIIDPIVNTFFIFDLQMSNNCNSARFGMQISKDDILGVLAKSIIVFEYSHNQQRNRYNHQMCFHIYQLNGHNQQKMYKVNKMELVQIMQGDYGCGVIER